MRTSFDHQNVRGRKIFCGTSGWPHQERKRLESLDDLSSRFGVVEIGSSFHEPLRPELTALWARHVATKPKFRFTAKLHRQFTHERRLDPASVREFIAGLAPLAEKGQFGCLLMQFPWSFRFTAENRAFLIRLRRAFSAFPLAAEMRHASWSSDEAIGTFIDYRMAFCNIDQPEYTKAMGPSQFLTSSVGYVRLHGRSCFPWYADREAGAGTARYDYLYPEHELREWQARIEHISGYAEETFVVLNNDKGRKSQWNAAQLQAMLEGKPVDLVSHTLRREAQAALFTRYTTSFTKDSAVA